MRRGAPIARLAKDDLLAVYGLLRPGGGGLESLGLTRVVKLVGPCRIPGALYDLGDYPGLVHGEGEVAGALLRILDAGAGPMLDAYEDFDRTAPDTSLYVRERVRLSAPRLTAWVYVWRTGLDERSAIPSGDWFARRGRPSPGRRC